MHAKRIRFLPGRSSGEVLLDSSLRSKRCVGSTKPRTCVMRPWPPAVAGCRFCSALARRGSCHPSSELRTQTMNPGRTLVRQRQVRPVRHGLKVCRRSVLPERPRRRRTAQICSSLVPRHVGFLQSCLCLLRRFRIRAASDCPQSRQTAPRRRLGRARREHRTAASGIQA